MSGLTSCRVSDSRITMQNVKGDSRPRTRLNKFSIARKISCTSFSTLRNWQLTFLCATRWTSAKLLSLMCPILPKLSQGFHLSFLLKNVQDHGALTNHLRSKGSLQEGQVESFRYSERRIKRITLSILELFEFVIEIHLMAWASYLRERRTSRIISIILRLQQIPQRWLSLPFRLSHQDLLILLLHQSWTMLKRRVRLPQKCNDNIYVFATFNSFFQSFFSINF